ncbi:MAG: hypothetical protein AMXMBFR84_26180 [Candidatus Hydrogenedentota bacterium]
MTLEQIKYFVEYSWKSERRTYRSEEKRAKCVEQSDEMLKVLNKAEESLSRFTEVEAELIKEREKAINAQMVVKMLLDELGSLLDELRERREDGRERALMLEMAKYIAEEDDINECWICHEKWETDGHDPDCLATRAQAWLETQGVDTGDV